MEDFLNREMRWIGFVPAYARHPTGRYELVLFVIDQPIMSRSMALQRIIRGNAVRLGVADAHPARTELDALSIAIHWLSDRQQVQGHCRHQSYKRSYAHGHFDVWGGVESRFSVNISK